MSAEVQTNETISRQHKLLDEVQHALDVAYASSMAIESPLTVVANLLLLMAIIYRRKLHTTDCCTIASLAVANIFMGLTDMPMDAIVRIPNLEPLVRSNRPTCFFWWFSGTFGLFSSLNSLCLLSIERCIAIIWPLHYHKWLTLKRVLGVIVIVWVLEGMRASLIFFVGKYFESAPTLKGKCNYYYGLPKWFQNELGNYKVYVTFAISIVCCSLAAFIACRQVRRLEKTVGSTPTPAERRAMKRRKRNVGIAALVNYIVFLMWLPIQVESSVSRALELTYPQAHVIHTVGIIVLKTSLLVSPLVIALCRPTIRQAFLFFLTTPPWKWSEVRDHEIKDTTFLSKTSSGAPDVMPTTETPDKGTGEDVEVRNTE
ncbi:alpha-1A adrenergic receptor isoform X2 [Aplysia californica]|uniref:Alpha-1A adrenergic receptor isoform X2 n=1 Tax=Aplysia californica TaxID=6500 RepID=A0ABM1A5K6_APLCA|nr:alpha-1A adrenergic receptor isoform X2 [Aplysia californica]